MAKTKKPTGLTIARNGYTFTMAWKQGDKDYGDGQQLRMKINDKTWLFPYPLSANVVGEKATSYKRVLDGSRYYPTAGKPPITKFTLQVRGNRKSYKSKGKSVNPGWSEWAEKTYTIHAPYKPVIIATLDSTFTNKTVFSWSVAEDEKHMFAKVEYQTALAKDGANPSYGNSVFKNSKSGEIPITEDTSVINDGSSYRRYVRIRSLGLGGSSAWVETSHIYSDPKIVTNATASATEKQGSIDVVMNFNTSKPSTNPIDSIKSQYLIIVPGEGITIPTGASWSDAETVAYKSGKDTVRFSISDTFSKDNVLFVRANTIHDSNETMGNPVVALLGKLEDPDTPTMQIGSDYQIQVTSKNNSAVPGSFLAVEFHDLDDANNSYIAGIIEGEDTDVTIQCPVWDDDSKISIGVRAVVGEYETDERSDGSTMYTIRPYNNGIMESDTKWTSTVIRPSDIVVSQSKRVGTAKVEWKWNQKDVTGVQIAWADHDDAWESTDEPEVYEVSSLYSPAWNISGLETGKIWYFRLRFYIEGDDSTQYGPWSDTIPLSLTSAPAIPTLVLSNSIVVQGEEIDASWVYISTDGTPQEYAELREVVFSGGQITYGDIIDSTNNGSKFTINPTELGWSTGETHYLALMVRSTSGRDSEWSEYVSIHVVEPVECEISNSSLVAETWDGRNILSLKDMPLIVNVDGAGSDKTTSIVIERTDAYILERPDKGKDFEGYEGEAVFVYNQTGDGQITINLDDLIGRLDDGAPYRLVAIVSDEYGQKSEDTKEFEVHWTHQASIPFGEVSIEPDYGVAFIIPVSPANAIESDTCDIYRLSADKPTLIYPNAIFGETYVDPFPTIGSSGGYRIVLKTINGDYITEDNHLAWTDVEGSINVKGSIIDFDDNQIILTRNVDTSHSWSKDFSETKYLGGSVQGDWNPAVGRTASVSSTAITLIDENEIDMMRDLAVYTNICNLRTMDGSNFKCDIQVSESRPHDKGGYIANFSLSITKVDSQDYDGMTLSEWLHGIASDHTFFINEVGNLIEDSDSASGYTFNIDDDAHLIMTVDDNALDSIDFTVEDGRLVVTYFED